MNCAPYHSLPIGSIELRVHVNRCCGEETVSIARVMRNRENVLITQRRHLCSQKHLLTIYLFPSIFRWIYVTKLFIYHAMNDYNFSFFFLSSFVSARRSTKMRIYRNVYATRASFSSMLRTIWRKRPSNRTSNCANMWSSMAWMWHRIRHA